MQFFVPVRFVPSTLSHSASSISLSRPSCVPNLRPFPTTPARFTAPINRLSVKEVLELYAKPRSTIERAKGFDDAVKGLVDIGRGSYIASACECSSHAILFLDRLC